MQQRRSSLSHRILGLCTLSLALVLTHPGSTVGGRAGDAPPSICGDTHRPWLLGPEQSAESVAADSEALRVVTYNIHSGLGERHALRRPREQVEQNLRTIASDIAGSASEPVDVVALNEVDFDSRRSAGIDEAEFMAAELERLTGQSYTIIRGETWRRSFPGLQVRFGNALLSRLPVVSSQVCLLADDAPCQGAAAPAPLPSLSVRGWRGFFSEQRGVVKATLRAGDRLVDVLVTHLDPFLTAVRETQALHVLRRFVDPDRTTVLLGDLNAVSTSLTGKRRLFAGDRTLDILTSVSLADVRVSYAAEHALESLNQWPTFPAGAPVWPLDAVLASADLLPRTIGVIGDTASDHRGLFAHLALLRGESSVRIQQERNDRIRRAQLERILQCDLASAGARRERGWLIAQTGFQNLLQRGPFELATAASPIDDRGSSVQAGGMTPGRATQHDQLQALASGDAAASFITNGRVPAL